MGKLGQCQVEFTIEKGKESEERNPSRTRRQKMPSIRTFGEVQASQEEDDRENEYESETWKPVDCYGDESVD